MNRFVHAATAIVVTLAATAGVSAATPRDTLIRAAFMTHDKAEALTLVDSAYAQTTATLATSPNDSEAKLQQALAIGYRGQLKRSLGDAKAAHAAFVALAAANPRDAEAQIAIAGWHLTAVGDLGNFLAHSVLGASRSAGLASLDQAVSLGGNHAFFPGYAALIRIKLNSSDVANALKLAQRSAGDQATTPIDRVVQRAASRLIPLLQAGDGAAASRLATQLLPFGSLS
jgi:hypothetical protein